jgi:hypothetical protein
MSDSDDYDERLVKIGSGTFATVYVIPQVGAFLFPCPFFLTTSVADMKHNRTNWLRRNVGVLAAATNFALSMKP